jgi:hypothetical protein
MSAPPLQAALTHSEERSRSSLVTKQGAFQYKHFSAQILPWEKAGLEFDIHARDHDITHDDASEDGNAFGVNRSSHFMNFVTLLGVLNL